MALTRIARGALAVCLALGTSLVLVVQQAPPASAFQAPMPPPVTVPGSAYPTTSLSGMNANDYNRALSNNPMGYVTARSNTLLNKAGSALAVVSGVDVVYGLTVGPVTRLTGGSTSGSLFCDLGTLVVSSDCAITPAPEYVPNSDISGSGAPAGWNGVPYGEHRGWNNSNQYGGLGVTITSLVEEEVNGFPTLTVTYEANTLGEAVIAPKTLPQPTFLQPNGAIRGPTNVDYYAVWELGVHTVTWFGELGSAVNEWDFNFGGVKYFGKRNPLRPPDVASDPVRHWESRWECSDRSTGSETSEPFHESDDIYPIMPPATCDVGHAIMYEVLQVTEGLVDKIRVFFWEKTPGGKTEWEGVPGKCLDFVSCILEVLKVDPETGEEIDCMKHPDVCTDFDPFPPPRPQPDPDPEKYRCKWGGHVIALSDCAVYKPTLAEPESTTDPAPKPRPYGDPVTGDAPDDVPAPTPNPPGSESPGAPQDPNCPPPFKWNSLVNPWWYYQGVKCSLMWAFVPAGGFGIGAGLIAAWDDTALGDLADSVDDLSDVVMDGTCGELFSVEPSVFDGETFSVDTCHPFWTGAQPLRSLIGISFVVGATYTGLRIALGSFGIYLGVGGGKDT